MKLSSTNRIVAIMLAVALLAAGFWMLLLSPKREEASELSRQAAQVRESLAQHRAEVAAALVARREFAVDYQQLVVLGKAVPGDDDTASLLVQLNRVARDAHVDFQNFSLTPASGEEAAPVSAPAEGSVSPTEVAAATMPLGATIGPAGLGVMPYELTFKGDFFKIADFIHSLDSMVKTENANVAVDGRLITINGFSLSADGNLGFPYLQAEFSVTTYLTPPGQGIGAGPAPAAGPATATPASATIGATP